MAEFHFLRAAWLLALIPLAGVLWLVARGTRRSRGWQAVCDPQLLPYLLIGGGGKARRWPLAAVATAGLLAIIALAGPTWQRLPQPLYRGQSALVAVLDLSRSMNAADMPPSRLSRARLKLIDIFQRRRDGQTGLVVYAGAAFAVTPLTQDSGTLIALVPSLTTDLMPSHGDRADLGLKKAAQLLRQAGAPHGDILLVTDGVMDPRVDKVAARLYRTGIRVSVLGVGTPQGAPVPLPGGGFATDSHGNILMAKYDPAAMRRLAQIGGGRYSPMTTNDRGVNTLLAGIRARPGDQAAKATNLRADQWREMGPWLLLPLLFLAALAFRRGYLAAVVLVLWLPYPRPAQAMEWKDLWSTPNQQAARALARGRPEQAAKLFQNPAWKAAAQYRAGHYAQSLRTLQKLKTPDAEYNAGNALARLGRYREALAAYNKALDLDPHNADARYNRDLVKKQLAKKRRSQHENKSGNQGQSQKHGDNNQGSGAASNQAQQKKHGSDNKQDGGKTKTGQNQAQRSAEADGKKVPNQGNAKQQGRSKADADGHSAGHQQPAGRGQENGKAQAKAGPEKPQSGRKNPGDNQSNGQAAPLARAPGAGEQKPESETSQADAQWLRRVPDDPGGLLRRKFLYQYRHEHPGLSAEN